MYFTPERTFSVFFILIVTVITFSCQKEELVYIDKPVGQHYTPTETTRSVNNWIWDAMSELYYWNDELPDTINPDYESKPEIFVEKLKHPDDEFTQYLDFSESSTADYGDSTYNMGWFVQIGEFSNSPGKFFAVVAFVYPGSPAAKAGLKRGDIIIRFSGVPITEEYLHIFWTSTQLDLGMGELRDGYIWDANREVNLTADRYLSSPILKKSILGINNNTRIGYLAYTQFKSGNDGVFNRELDEVFRYFRDRDVRELILDLRYNTGGDLEAASHLASLIVPQNHIYNEDVFIKLEWNQRLMSLFKNTYGEDSDFLNLRFSVLPDNLDLNRIYILTTGSTASASELLITGLSPYLEVNTVGGITFGKQYGIYNLPYYGDSPIIERIFAPVCLRYRNIYDEPSQLGGLQPQYYADDVLIPGHMLGSTSDNITKRAYDLITNVSKSAPLNGNDSYVFTPINLSVSDLGSNLLINSNDFMQIPELK